MSLVIDSSAGEVGMIIPEPHPPLSARREFDVFATSIPARTFTGDFYHYARSSDGGLVLSVGDVAGKGLRAAVFMAMIHEELERLNEETADTCMVLSGLNKLLREQMPRNRFATMVTVRISPEGKARVVNAGHWPVLIRRSSGAVEIVKANGPALALFDGGCWRGESVQLHSGDLLVAYTDGIIEATSAAGEEFGIERLMSSLSLLQSAGAHDAARLIMESAHSFAGGPWSDDVTIATVRA